jgi:hypothetical protein
MKHESCAVALAGVVFVLVGTACANTTSSGGESTGIPHPIGTNKLVVRVETAGGLLAPAYALSRFPEFSLYGDGRVLTGGPQIQIYPGPALPNIRVTKVSEAGVQAILRAARGAGLLGPDRRFADGSVADAPTTTFTVVAAAGRHVTSVYALGMQASDQMSASERRARASLLALQAKLSNLTSWLPKGSLSRDESFVPSGLRVFVRPGPPAAQPPLEEPAIDWPLPTPLRAFGTSLATWPDLRCGAVTGGDLNVLLAAARRANELSPWRSGDATYSLTFRPLLPDESGCPR